MAVRPVFPAFSGIKSIIARAGAGDITLELRGTSEADWIDLMLHFRADSPVDTHRLAEAINAAQKPVAAPPHHTHPGAMMSAAPEPGTDRAQLEAFLAGRANP